MIPDDPAGAPRGAGETTGTPPPAESRYWQIDTMSLAGRVQGGSHSERIGRYRIERVLGEGGMGVVYLARQTEPVERTVALKLIRPGMDTREVVARFESERQALALMGHPNIASVHDAGTADDGSPYFVMEYVAGAPITQHANERRLGIGARLALFAQVCDAVQHAHQRAIIHRDLKPSNVLVAEIDGAAVPKIIDFGIAKAMSRRLPEDTVLTAMGQIIGTPEYMSPEQAGLNDLDIDTRTDIYSLGVLLYELLTGVLPFDSKRLRSGGYGGILRTICEEAPEKPSTRLRRLLGAGGAGGEGAPLAARPRDLRGDLDWIVLKALEKDRARRYASASELAADVRRHLSHEPVLAGPPSALYRLRKLARRHREKLIAAGALVVLIAAFLIVSSVRARRAALERSRENRAQGEAHALAFRQARTERDAARAMYTRKEAESEDWLPPWEIPEEAALARERDEAKRRMDDHYHEALQAFERARDAPAGSGERILAMKGMEALLRERFLEAFESGTVDLGRDFFRHEIESLGLDTYRAELEGKGTIALASDPPGAEVFCFRFEESEMRLIPLPFDPRAGLDVPARGLLGGAFLRVEQVWDPTRSPFEAGDRLLRAAGREVATHGDLAAALRPVGPDAAVKADVLRGGKEIVLDWTPFPSRLYAKAVTVRPGRLLDTFHQLGVTFAGYPLDLVEGSRVGTTGPGAPVKALLPRGSYLFVLRKQGHAETRVPLFIPRDAGERRVRLFAEDDVPAGFVHIPAGPFALGGDRESYQGLERGRDELPDLFMKRLEITFEEYLEFVNDLDRQGLIFDHDSEKNLARLQADWEGPELQSLRPAVSGEAKGAPAESAFDPSRELRVLPHYNKDYLVKASPGGGYELNRDLNINKDYPVIGISMIAGVEYAHWLTRKHGGRWRFRLPRDLEWEKAARGADGRLFVWGNELVLSFCRSADGSIPERNRGGLEIVGAYPVDESVHGVRDLAGSASEPVLRRAHPTLPLVGYHGGNWIATDRRDFRAATRNRMEPDGRYRYIGLRLVAEPPER